MRIVKVKPCLWKVSHKTKTAHVVGADWLAAFREACRELGLIPDEKERPTVEQLRSVRAAARLTQAEAASIIGIPRKTYVNWEQGVVHQKRDKYLSLIEWGGLQMIDMHTLGLVSLYLSIFLVILIILWPKSPSRGFRHSTAIARQIPFTDSPSIARMTVAPLLSRPISSVLVPSLMQHAEKIAHAPTMKIVRLMCVRRRNIFALFHLPKKAQANIRSMQCQFQV